MKKYFVTAAFSLLVLALQAQQSNNPLMSTDFWNEKTSVKDVQVAIANGADPAEVGPAFWDATSRAILAGAPLETVKFMVEQEGNGVFRKTHHSRSYLHWAASRGNVPLIKYLIQKGADINYKDSHGDYVIVSAATGAHKNPEVFDVFFQAGIDPLHKYEDETTLLLLGVSGDKDFKLTDYFISKGLSLTDKDSYGTSAADFAARLGDQSLIKKLIARGVSVSPNALFIAAQGARGHQNGLETYKFLVEDLKLNPQAVNGRDGGNILHALASRGKADVINYFLNKGVDVNQIDNEGNNVLIKVATTSGIELLNSIIKKTTNINLKNSKGFSALTQAISLGKAETSKVLLEAGADVNVKDVNGNNLVYYWFNSYRETPGRGATGNPLKEFQEKQNLLKSAGLNLSVNQEDGTSLFHIAVEKSSLALVDLAASLGANINAQDNEGTTALHKAALTAKDDVLLKKLISLGADTKLKTEFEETAYDLAKANEFLSKNNISIDFLK